MLTIQQEFCDEFSEKLKYSYFGGSGKGIDLFIY